MVNTQAVMKLLNQMKRRIQLTVDRAIVTTVNNTLKRQNLQLTVLQGEDVDSVERFIDYGLISYPPDGSEAIVACPGGNRNSMVAISVDDKATRHKDGEPGDSGLYHLEGHLFILTKEGVFNLSGKRFNLHLDTEVVITTPSLVINADDTTINGNLKVTGEVDAPNVKASKSLKVGDIDVGTHTHKDAEDRPTSPPTPSA
ncbi:phage baseplate assembly protein V [Vibrio jasicida]|uniref:phage baseplate assembly protein V n=1 Tax=Vibrio jasicida TaxID=766224 RepID=UPI000CE34327|nr:phage baseplate assembly protein V [Vibrio jasicida]